MRALPELLGRPRTAQPGPPGTAADHGVEVTVMTQDLAALAPSAIVCVAFLIGAWMLLRRELAPKRRARTRADADAADARAEMRDERSEP